MWMKSPDRRGRRADGWVSTAIRVLDRPSVLNADPSITPR